MYYDDDFVLSLPDEDYEKILLVLDKYYENKNELLLDEYDETVDLIKIILENSTEFEKFLIFDNRKW